jgi:hypothetical protein
MRSNKFYSCITVITAIHYCLEWEHGCIHAGSCSTSCYCISRLPPKLLLPVTCCVVDSSISVVLLVGVGNCLGSLTGLPVLNCILFMFFRFFKLKLRSGHTIVLQAWWAWAPWREEAAWYQWGESPNYQYDHINCSTGVCVLIWISQLVHSILLAVSLLICAFAALCPAYRLWLVDYYVSTHF